MRISRITPDGRIEPLAGSSRAAGLRAGSQDLSLAHPAQTFQLDWNLRMAAAPLPDGTLVFTVEGNRIAALAPDGAVVTLPYVHGHSITCLTATSEQEIVFTDTQKNLWPLDRDGRSSWLVQGEFTQVTLTGPRNADHLPMEDGRLLPEGPLQFQGHHRDPEIGKGLPQDISQHGLDDMVPGGCWLVREPSSSFTCLAM